MQQKNELPEGWISAKFEEITQNFDGKRVPLKSSDRKKRQGQYPYYGASGIIDYIDDYIFDGEFLLISEDGANLVARSTSIAFIAKGQFWVNNHAHIVKTHSNIPLEFLSYFFNSINLLPFVTGSAQPKLTQGNLNNIGIPLPPLSEQHRIVSAIEALFARLDATNEKLDRVPEILKKFRQSVLAAACDGRLTEGWRKENPEMGDGIKLIEKVLENRREIWKERKLEKKYATPQEVDTPDLPFLPKSWAWATLDQLVQEGRPIIYGIIKPGPNTSDGVPYVRVNEMADGKISDVSDLKRASTDIAKKFSRATLRSGDILISKDGTIGKVAIVPPELEGGNINQHIVRATIHYFIDKNYVVNSIRSSQSQNWLDKEKKGVALQGVNVEDFRRLPLPIPPLPEQREIVRRVDALFAFADFIEAKVAAARGKTEKLRQSILAKAFSGELVETEAEIARREGRDYETAEVLLERIKKERGKSGKN